MTLFKGAYRIESARLHGYDYASPGLYFVTICTRNRECFFGDVVGGEMVLSPIGKIVADEWQKTPRVRPNVELDEWIVMPNHLHGILVIKYRAETGHGPEETGHRPVSTSSAQSRLQSNSLGAILAQTKSICTKRIRTLGTLAFDWQERFHDEIIRNQRALNAIRAYIIDNPANWNKDEHNPAGWPR